MENLITTKQAALKFGISRATIESWYKKGWLVAVESPYQPRQFLQSAIQGILDNQKKKRTSCRVCESELTSESRYPNNNICLSCHAEYHRNKSCDRRKADPLKMRESVKRSNAKTKEMVFLHYGDGVVKCKKCGYDDSRALSIDHVGGGGVKHRQNVVGGGGMKMYNWLKKNNLPDGYQLLCMNCQFIKRYTNNEQTHHSSSK